MNDPTLVFLREESPFAILCYLHNFNEIVSFLQPTNNSNQRRGLSSSSSPVTLKLGNLSSPVFGTELRKHAASTLL